jgi:hypothetical protein
VNDGTYDDERCRRLRSRRVLLGRLLHRAAVKRSGLLGRPGLLGDDRFAPDIHVAVALGKSAAG